jgi:hypothetical protein
MQSSAAHAARAERDVSATGQEHQQYRNEHGEERDAGPADPRRRAFQLQCQRVLWRECGARAIMIEPAGQRRRRQPDDERIENRAPDIGLSGHRQHRRRVRRDQAVPEANQVDPDLMSDVLVRLATANEQARTKPTGRRPGSRR